jgi:5-methylcytosine-specific restriction protein A
MRRPPILPENERVKRKRGRAGQRQRQRRLERTSGLCELCLDRGRTRLATVVNHKTPLAFGGSDEDHNTENLCAECDAEVTAQQFGHHAPAPARGIGRSGRPTSPDHPWNAARRATSPGR